MWRVDPKNERAMELHAELAPLVGDTLDGPDVCVVVGGDGWMLHSLAEVPGDPIFLGLNGGTLGFLLNDVKQIAATAEALRERRWQAHAFPRLALTGTTPTQETLKAQAVNDLYVERKSGQTAHLQVRVDGERVVNKLVCDGLIVSTALGSTAYNFSAGGVPSHPLVPAIQITPIAPHSPRLSPVLLPLGARITVKVLAPERRPVRAIADGLEVGEVVHMRVGRSPHDVRIAFLEGHRFTRALIRKVLKS